MNRIFSLMILWLIVAGMISSCANVGTFPSTTLSTSVDLRKSNFRIIKSNAIGKSSGFILFWFIPIVQPTYTGAMSDLYEKAGVAEGRAQALVNVTQENSKLSLLLFSIPRLTVRADIIEFIEENPQK